MRNLQKSVLSTMLALSVLGSSAFALTPDASGEGAADTADTEQAAVAAQTTQDTVNDPAEAAQQAENAQSASVQAASETAINKVVYPKEDLNVHSGPGTKYSVLGTLKKGQKVTAIAIDGYWYKISYKGQYGYISISYTTDDPSVKNPDSEETEIHKYVVATETINIHSAPGTKYSVLGTLAKGTKVKAIAVTKDGDWYKINYKNDYGYISVSYTTENPDKPNVTPLKKTVKVTARVLRIRKGPGSSYATMGTLRKGEKAYVTGVCGDWYQIKLSHDVGYINKAYTRDLYKQVRVTANKLYVRSGAGQKYSVIGTLKKGAKVRVAATKGSWYKIVYGDGYGYIKSKYTK